MIYITDKLDLRSFMWLDGPVTIMPTCNAFVRDLIDRGCEAYMSAAAARAVGRYLGRWIVTHKRTTPTLRDGDIMIVAVNDGDVGYWIWEIVTHKQNAR